MVDVLYQASIFALLSLVVAVAPMGMAILYAVRPSERRLALMRPISLAGLFAGLAGAAAGGIMVLRHLATAPDYGPALIGAAESLVPLLVAFGSLTIAWLCVALGLSRQAP
jgi:hypothetical protein